MSMFTQRFTATTPSSYLRNAGITRLFVIDNALDSDVTDLIEMITEYDNFDESNANQNAA
jgi:hypothetical protein